ncbi:MAG: alpha/beta fold hydrolase [Pseudomonadota bacterium]
MPSRSNRRQFAAGLAAVPLAGLAARRARSADSRDFVLIPGTWHGGWVWTPVANRLIRAGHRAFAITCTGVGERAHLATPNVGLDTHIDDVSRCIELEELDDVTLVAHSFGGITATGVCDRFRERIRRVVFFDAFVPTPERAAWVRRNEDGAWPDWWLARRGKFVDGYLMDFFAEYPLKMLIDPADHPTLAESVRQRLTYHPAKQWTDPVSFANGGWQGLPRAYVHCVGQEFRQSSAAMYGPAQAPGWDWFDLPTQRLGMLTHPGRVAELLLAL